MAKHIYTGWQTYEELKEDYTLNRARPSLSIYHIANDDQAIIIDYSEYAILSYGVDQCKKAILAEIKSLDDPKNEILEEFLEDIDSLIANYKDKVKTDWIGSPTKELPQISKRFLKDSHVLIEKYQPQIRSNTSWKPFLSNGLLLLTVIGTLPALFSMGMKATTGRYSFFDCKFLTPEQRSRELPSQIEARNSQTEPLGC